MKMLVLWSYVNINLMIFYFYIVHDINSPFFYQGLPGDAITAHCRFLVPDNIQKILMEISHHFWLKNDGEKWSRKNYFEIPRWPSELLLPSAKKSAQKD